jgi:hypothetical protein
MKRFHFGRQDLSPRLCALELKLGLWRRIIAARKGVTGLRGGCYRTTHGAQKGPIVNDGVQVPQQPRTRRLVSRAALKEETRATSSSKESINANLRVERRQSRASVPAGRNRRPAFEAPPISQWHSLCGLQPTRPTEQRCPMWGLSRR